MVNPVIIKSNPGFTLLEVLIYLALFSVIATSGIAVTYQLFRSTAATKQALSLQTESDFVMSKLAWALSGSSLVTLPNSTTLKIVRTTIGSDSPVIFSVQSNRLYVSRGVGTSTELTAATVNVHDVHFSLIGHILTSTFWLDNRVFYSTAYVNE